MSEITRPRRRGYWTYATAAIIGVAVVAGAYGATNFDRTTTARRATMANIAVSPTPVLLGAYLTHRNVVTSAYERAQLASQGWVVTFTISLEGFGDENCVLTWTLKDALTSAPVPDTFWLFTNVSAWPDGVFFGSESSTPMAGEVWIPRPTSLGSYALEFEVCQSDDGTLARATAVPLTVGQGIQR